MLRRADAAAVILPVVALAAGGSSVFMLVALVIGVPLAARGSDYWLEVWLAFDKLVNAALGHDHRETLSGRLGKSVYHNHPPVFFYYDIDFLIVLLLEQFEHNHCLDSIDWMVGRSRC